MLPRAKSFRSCHVLPRGMPSTRTRCSLRCICGRGPSRFGPFASSTVKVTPCSSLPFTLWAAFTRASSPSRPRMNSTKPNPPSFFISMRSMGPNSLNRSRRSSAVAADVRLPTNRRVPGIVRFLGGRGGCVGLLSVLPPSVLSLPLTICLLLLFFL